ncbi:MAG: fluoride efflux transporter CrcB [Chitinophagales bacterium]|nr:fluoride efflux transporter CrcB [Chitinophagales bacterium]MDW8420049.1 fluoride efflux transporter CrcB [Chitinophagales bacterium]
MKEIILVFAGGGIGSVARYLLSRWVSSWHQHPFPLGTLVVNIVACVVLGASLEYMALRGGVSQHARLLLAVGFCGGFSTFSTFSHESIALYQQGNYITLAMYIVMSVALCMAAVWLGSWAAGRFVSGG